MTFPNAPLADPPIPHCPYCGKLSSSVAGVYDQPRCDHRCRERSDRPVSPPPAAPETPRCPTPDCTIILAHDGPCVPAGSYSTMPPAPSPERAEREPTPMTDTKRAIDALRQLTRGPKGDRPDYSGFFSTRNATLVMAEIDRLREWNNRLALENVTIAARDRLRAAPTGEPSAVRCPKCGGPLELWQQEGRRYPAIRCLTNGCTWPMPEAGEPSPDLAGLRALAEKLDDAPNRIRMVSGSVAMAVFFESEAERAATVQSLRALAGLQARAAEAERDAELWSFVATEAATVHCNFIGGDEAWSATVQHFDGGDDSVAHGRTPREAVANLHAALRPTAPPAREPETPTPETTDG